jgi:hypothetical protein
MSHGGPQTTQVHGASPGPYGDSDPFGSRDVAHQREAAEAAMTEFAAALRYWNAPDDEHTRIQLRALVEAVIEETFRV